MAPFCNTEIPAPKHRPWPQDKPQVIVREMQAGISSLKETLNQTKTRFLQISFDPRPLPAWETANERLQMLLLRFKELFSPV